MAELGKIHPVKKAACPYCGALLPGKPELYRHAQALKCPKCQKLIKGSAPALDQSKFMAMDFSAQLLQWQIRTQTPEPPGQSHDTQ